MRASVGGYDQDGRYRAQHQAPRLAVPEVAVNDFPGAGAVTARILQGDMREKLADLADESIDSIVTDPPYHLTTGKKGGSGLTSLNEASPAGRSRIGAGFMGEKWDGGDVAFQPATWALLLRVAKPGAHLLAFGGSRTFHRLWCAVEDAGWEIRDTILWLHGEGFPKSSNQGDKWKGWGTALKPAFEPILLARKPLIGTVAENLRGHGVGALNIEACRIGSGEDKTGGGCAGITPLHGGGIKQRAEVDYSKGRWPANVLHDGSDEVVTMFPDARGQQGRARTDGDPQGNNTFGALRHITNRPEPRGDSGSAARFFWCPKASRRDREEGCEGLPLREGGVRSETSGQHITRRDGGALGPVTNHHPTVKPTELMQYLIRLVTPKGGTVLDPFMGSGSTGKACEREGMSFVGIELDTAYIEIAKRRIIGVAPLFAEVQA